MGFIVPSVVSLLALALQANWGAAEQIVLDDMDSTLKITKVNTEQFVLDDMDTAGFQEACLSDAYNGNFHQDEGMNKGDASFTVEFQPPRSGCYAIQEHHPGRDPDCRRHLPQNVSLTVNYCRGLSTTIYYDQSSSATVGKWNTLGMWMFFEGWSGALTVRNHAHENCLTGECLMVVDAFRLTRVSDTCAHATAPAPAPVVLPAGAPGSPEQGWEHGEDAMVAPGPAPEQGLESEGLLTLQVVGATRDSLWDLRATIGDALEAHFALEQVSILSLEAASGRRLSGADAASFEARFTGRGQASEVPATGNLAAALQASLDAAGSTALVTSAGVDWVAAYPFGPAGAGPGERSVSSDPDPMWLWVPALCVILALCAWRLKKVARRDAVDVEAPPERPFDAVDPPEANKWAEAPPGKPLDAANPPESDKWDVISVSTGSPESESISSERPSTTESVEPVGVVGTCA